MATALSSILLVVFATLVGAFGPILLKKASEKKLSRFKSLLTNYNLHAGVFLYAAGTILFILALRNGELSVLYPFVSLGYVWVCLLSMRFLNERMNWQKWAGIAFIILGVSFIGIGS
ncbi:MAG TPA: EamA family transporter [Candidatus Nanoarchaeia archaeon]|nr:EamA family transporter [Candidatus Nanoarchaeia archaeon]